LLIAAGGVAAAVGAVLALYISRSVGLSFLAGAAVGTACFSAVFWRVRSITARSRWLRLLGGLLRSGYYLLLVGALYLLVVVWGAQVVWVIVGYTYALTIFAVYMLHAAPKKARPPVEGN